MYPYMHIQTYVHVYTHTSIYIHIHTIHANTYRYVHICIGDWDTDISANTCKIHANTCIYMHIWANTDSPWSYIHYMNIWPHITTYNICFWHIGFRGTLKWRYIRMYNACMLLVFACMTCHICLYVYICVYMCMYWID